jgi:hypothetical protein
MAHTVIPTSYFAASRESWAAWQALIVRARGFSPSLPSLPKQISFNRWSVLAIDALFAAVAAADGKSPNKMFDAHNWYLGRDRVNQLVLLEQRIASLGF